MAQEQKVQAASAGGAVAVAPTAHADTTAKWFLVSSVAYFVIVGIVAILIAAKFVWPELLGTVSIMTYGRLRPLHVNGMLFGTVVRCPPRSGWSKTRTEKPGLGRVEASLS